MPVDLTRGERKALLWMLLSALALVIVTILFTPRKSEEAFFPSSYSPNSRGGKAGFLLLQQLGYRVERWEKPLSDLPQTGAGTALILARSSGFGQREQRDAMKKYIATGGRVICFGYSPEWILPHGSVESNSAPETQWKERTPALPSRITRGGPITTNAESHWVGDASTDVVHYKSDGGPIVVSYSFGQGEVVWWDSATPVTNAGISRPGNLELLLNSIGGRDVRVLWNEYSGREYKTLWQRAWETPVKWIFTQGALFAIVLLLTFSRRSGPLRPHPARSRLSPLEFTETLGALYKRAHATGFALEAGYKHLRARIASKYGIRRDASADIVARSLSARFPALDREFGPTLHEVERAMHDTSLTEDKALELVQKLQAYAALLQIAPKTEKS